MTSEKEFSRDGASARQTVPFAVVYLPGESPVNQGGEHAMSKKVSVHGSVLGRLWRCLVRGKKQP